MSIQIEYTEAGDLLIRCGNDTMVWPLASALRAAMAVGAGSPAAPTSSSAPSVTPAPAPAPAPSTAAPPPKPPKIGYPPPLPGAMTFIVSRRSSRGLQMQTYPWFAADWPVANGLQIPLEQLQQVHPELLMRDLHVLQAAHPQGLAGRCLTVLVQPSSLHEPLDVGRLQWLADDPSLGLEGVRLQFGAPDADELR